ncbi:antibiotic biosynthesis monooxygenase [Rhizobium leguminosarum]|uniref:antibiotic biosynthesis monooxygenase family protein n=1 Tax=Rhizobium leguminosarum TaxID=384 RepID=UPI003F9B5B90
MADPFRQFGRQDGSNPPEEFLSNTNHDTQAPLFSLGHHSMENDFNAELHARPVDLLLDPALIKHLALLPIAEELWRPQLLAARASRPSSCSDIDIILSIVYTSIAKGTGCMKQFSFTTALAVTALLACVVTPIGAPQAQDAAGTIIAIPITVREDQPTAPAIARMKEIMTHLAGQPGLIDQSLLASVFPNNKPSHIWLSRWRSASDWEALGNSPEFLDLLPQTAGYFDFKTAEIFKTVP